MWKVWYTKTGRWDTSYRVLGHCHTKPRAMCSLSMYRTLSLWVLKPGITSTCHSRSQGSWHGESCFMTIHHVHLSRRTLHPDVGDSARQFSLVTLCYISKGSLFSWSAGDELSAAHSRQACLHQAVDSTNNFISQIKDRHDIKLKNVF